MNLIPYLIILIATRSCCALIVNNNTPMMPCLRHTHRLRQRSSHKMMSVSSSSLRLKTKTLRPLVVCGPSGVGKGTIINRFMQDSLSSNLLPKFAFSVSHTTRQPRPGEVDGVHYNFVTREFFEEKIASNDFYIEWAEVHGNMYGTSFQAISDVSKNTDTQSEIQNIGGDAEKHCLLDIDVAGVKSIKAFQAQQQKRLDMEPNLGKAKSTQQYLANDMHELPQLLAKFIFIAPPSMDALRDRLINRGTETPETLERRFQNARAELDYGLQPGNFDAVVVNDDLEKAVSEFTAAVMDIYLSD